MYPVHLAKPTAIAPLGPQTNLSHPLQTCEPTSIRLSVRPSVTIFLCNPAALSRLRVGPSRAI
jgi:hypothetical protein